FVGLLYPLGVADISFIIGSIFLSNKLKGEVGDGRINAVWLINCVMFLRKYTVVITILLCMACAFTRAQTQEQRDSIVHAVCVELASSTDLPDSTRIISAYEKHLYPFVMKFDERTHREIITNVHYRLQRNCREFAIILDRLEENYGDWAFVESKPATSLNKKTCRGFMRHKKY